MSQDYSRINFDPMGDYLGVLLQQGRPLTDADWNALVAQVNRRTHAGSYDTFGPAVVPETTPDGFLITPVPGGFTIGRGRIYVDGILAENHGAGALTWDPHLAEEFRPDPVVWNAQPYGHTPTIPAGFPYLVYVDVWQREVGPLEDPREDGNTGTPGRLVDVAVGVDTTARLQTVWQVRTLGGLEAGMDCSTPLSEIEDWATVTAPSAGRLTTATGVVAGEPDPCLVPPLGGYKGAENQLYRVEVHEGGIPGVATFKWSRDNASIQSPVQTIPTLSTLIVDSVGKDDVLRFKDGDWIEITNDERELNGEPGILRRIALVGGVNDSTRTLTLAAPLAAGDFPVDADDVPTGTHTRMRRWNQTSIVKRADGTTYTDLDAGGATGEITIPADGTQLLLENGILVSFGVATAGGRFRRGDWWVFAARTNDASVEILNAAPPRGIHHHYAKLAVVLSDDEADDCREIWPPDRGCCTVVVQPGESIQAAINSLPDTGGCVCLKSGVHEIDAPIEIARSNITLHGEAPEARVVGGGLEFLLMVGGEGLVENIEIAMISFEYNQVSDFSSPRVMLLIDSRRVHVHDCALRSTSLGLPQITGICTVDSIDVRVQDSLFERCYWGVSAAGTSQLVIEGNTLHGALYKTPDASIPSGVGAYFVEGSDGEVRGNYFENFEKAVAAWGGNATITDNDITRRALPASLDNPTQPGELLYAISVLATERSRVHGNRIDLASQSYGGVLITGRYDEVSNNRFTSTYATPSLIGPISVFAGDFSGEPSGAGDFAIVALNHFEGVQVAIMMRNPRSAHIADNTITGVERSGIGIMLDDCEGVVVADNSLRDLGLAFALTNGNSNRLLDNSATDLLVAALIVGERAPELDGNVFDEASLMGVAMLNLESNARVLNTRIAHCGYAAGAMAFSLGLGQPLELAFHEVTIEGCEFLHTGVSADGTQQTGGVAFGVASLLVSHLQIANNRTAYSSGTKLAINREHRALLLIGLPCFISKLAAGIVEVAFGAALITGNVFEGPSQTRLVDIRRIGIADNIDLRFEKLTFANNRCDHLAPGNDAVITADLFGSHMIVTGNQVKTPRGGFSIGLGGRDNVALMSNYTTRPYTAVGSTVPAVLANFNVIL